MKLRRTWWRLFWRLITVNAFCLLLWQLELLDAFHVQEVYLYGAIVLSIFVIFGERITPYEFIIYDHELVWYDFPFKRRIPTYGFISVHMRYSFWSKKILCLSANSKPRRININGLNKEDAKWLLGALQNQIAMRRR